MYHEWTPVRLVLRASALSRENRDERVTTAENLAIRAPMLPSINWVDEVKPPRAESRKEDGVVKRTAEVVARQHWGTLRECLADLTG